MPKKVYKNWSIEDFEIGSFLGEGPFSWICSAREKETGYIVALKFIDKSFTASKDIQKQIVAEISNQGQIKHPNIIELYGYFYDYDHIVLIMELGPKGDLFTELTRSGTFSEQDTVKYVHDICKGLSHLHKKRIIHRDIKPENILLDINNKIKIADFGCSTRKSYEVRSNTAYNKGEKDLLCGTIDYMSPEMINGTGHDEKIDCWAVGVLTYECMCGYPPFKDEDTVNEGYNEVISKIKKSKFIFPEHLSIDCIDLITRLLKIEPSERLSIREVLNHPFIRDNFSEN